ncbi:YppE family protein [Neobacillus novalis]|uniref:YppE family protein n=1 Tax=Neobacillus novalis TaxID=220687 RepID=A0AA95MIX5_9BACI|nr:YppE family protein [Neobacillus novalis]WHY84410.1 YppE family protein [Neobacillus novalis]
MMSEEIIHITETLLQHNRLFLEYYQEARETGITKDFHEVIKPFADEVKALTEQWKGIMIKWLAETSPKHIHLKQIDTTTEHIELLSIQCFFSNTSKKRFLDTNRTVEFFLQEILKEVGKDKRDA